MRCSSACATQTSLDVKRADFKLDMLPPHLFMNLRVVDEHGRQLGMGRNLGALKAELGAQARGAFQALAGLNVEAGAGSEPPKRAAAPGAACAAVPSKAATLPLHCRPASATRPGPSASCPS